MRTASLVSARRRRRSAGLAAAVLASLLALAAPAAAVIPPGGEDAGQEQLQPATLAPDRSGVVVPGTPFTWTGAVATGRNVAFDPAQPGSCSKEPQTYCDITLVDVHPGDFYGARARRGVLDGRRSRARHRPLRLRERRLRARVGELVGASGGATEVETGVGRRAPGLLPRRGVLLQRRRDSGYDGKAEFFRRNAIPTDIDDPPGIQDDPGERSEPRLPVALRAAYRAEPDEPELLVGGLEDVQPRPRLARRVRVQDRDLRLLRPRPHLDRPRPAQHRARSSRRRPSLGRWATRATRRTTRTAAAPDPRTPTTRAARATSARSTSPPTPGSTSTTRATPTRWCSTRRRSRHQRQRLGHELPPLGDAVAAGHPARAHVERPHPDQRLRDRRRSRRPRSTTRTPSRSTTPAPTVTAGPGIIVACWGQNFGLPASPRQRIVCERSTDGGRTWPDEPDAGVAAVEPALRIGPFVIGVHVVADTRDPDTFYAVWLDTCPASSTARGTNTL